MSKRWLRRAFLICIQSGAIIASLNGATPPVAWGAGSLTMSCRALVRGPSTPRPLLIEIDHPHSESPSAQVQWEGISYSGQAVELGEIYRLDPRTRKDLIHFAGLNSNEVFQTLWYKISTEAQLIVHDQGETPEDGLAQLFVFLDRNQKRLGAVAIAGFFPARCQ